ncbi:MAG: LysM peptidoglycan-binding domain-containing protein [Dehalococcoidia bacterium]
MRLAALLTAVLLTFAAACGDDDGILQPEESNTPIATATPYAVQPNVIIVSGNGTGGSTGGATTGNGGATGGGSTGGDVNYVVQAGDTLIALAGRYGTTVEAIMTRNNLESASDLRAGQEIVIPSGQSTVAPPAATSAATPAATSVATAPPAGTAVATSTPAGEGERYTVQSGDLAGSIAVRFGVTLEQLAAANNRTVESLDELSVGDVLIIPGG